MQTITCKDCEYILVNYSDTVFTSCPNCDSFDIKVEIINPKSYKGICDICGEEKEVTDIEIDPYAVIAVCKACREEHNMETE